jgi:hypothetical protein|tara:strand:- start:2022 stop:2258 length:237 start_codon:yes stop_codon:yes gene_type:complete
MFKEIIAMTTSQPYDPSNPFKVGNNLCWLHGEHYRVAEVLEVEEDRVKLSGLTSDYWRSKKSLLPRLDKTPINTSSGF